MKFLLPLNLLLLLSLAPAFAAPPPKTNVPAAPPDVATPSQLDTRVGTLKFYDGLPLEDSVAKIYDNLDFMRGVEVFLNAAPGAAAVALRDGLRSIGANNRSVALFSEGIDSQSILLTADPGTVTVWAALDLKDGALVLESPPETLGTVIDFWFRPLIDTGNVGPDRGRGGKFLLLPPGYDGPLPTGYVTARSPTFNVLYVLRGLTPGGDPKPVADGIRQKLRIYPLAEGESAPPLNFIEASGKAFNAVQANNFHFFEQVHTLVQEEPNNAQSEDVLGLMAAIGIEKGKPFSPDARMKRLLSDAADVGNATARALLFATRDKDAFPYPKGQWKTAFIGNSHRFERDDVRLLDARTMFHYYSTGITPALAAKRVGVGVQSVYADRDLRGNFLVGNNTYKLRLPANPPVANFWSLSLYDPQTRSLLRTESKVSAISSESNPPVANADGSVDIYIGPKAPAGKEKNWLPTARGKAWFVMLRMYGPLEGWFDKTWRPSDLEPVT